VSRPGGAPRARGLMLNSLFCEDKGQIDGKAVRQGSQASCITGCLNDRSKARWSKISSGLDPFASSALALPLRPAAKHRQGAAATRGRTSL